MTRKASAISTTPSHLFPHRAAAIEWYGDHGGAQKHAYLYKKIPCNPDKTVDKMWVAEYLISELRKYEAKQNAVIADGDYTARKAKADTEKAESDAKIARIKADEAERELDKKWLHRDQAEEAMAALIGSISDALDNQNYIKTPDIIVAAGGDGSRTEEVSEVVRAIISNAFTEILAEGRIEGAFEDSAEEIE